MNNVFELNKVYSNPAFYAAAANDALNLARFNTSLYKKNPENCPWPKTMDYSRRMISETKELFAYFEVVHKTKCYVHFLENGRFARKLKIRKDDEGNEFVVIDGKRVLFATQALKYSPDEAKAIYNNSKIEIQKMNNFLRKLEEIEEYGYTYVNTPALKVCSESELRKAVGFYDWQVKQNKTIT